MLWPDRQISPEERLKVTTPDFSVACITFESGVVARLTCSLVAPFNHVLKITGDTGVITVNEVWNYTAKVYVDKYTSMRYRAERYSITKEHPVIANLVGSHKVYPPVRKANLKSAMPGTTWIMDEA